MMMHTTKLLISKRFSFLRLLAALLSVTFFTIALPTISLAAPISGVISLPGGAVAPAGGILLSLSARDTSGAQSFVAQNFLIAEGQNSVSYSIDLIPDDPSATWRIQYICFANFIACRDYVRIAFYSSAAPNNITYIEDEATTVSQGSNNVNFSLLDGITLSGSLTSPTGNAPAGGIDIQMFFQSIDFSVSNVLSFEILEGQSSFDFAVTVPDDANLTYRVNYRCDTRQNTSGVCENNFISSAFFQSTAPGNTTANIDNAEGLAGDASRSNIDMTLLTGASISGAISRLSGTNINNDVDFLVRAVDQTGGNDDSFSRIIIPSGSLSQTYSLIVPPSAAANWQLIASCSSFITPDGCADYSNNSFYDTDTPGTNSSADSDAADLLAGNTVHTNIDFTPVGLSAISGIIMLPDPNIAPSGGIALTVSAQEFTGGDGGLINETIDLTIPQNSSFIPFNIPIPNIPGSEWLLAVSCDESATPVACRDYARGANFYDADSAPDNTTLIQADADPLSGNNTGINLTLIESLTSDEQLCFPILAQNNKVALICL